MQRNIKIWHVPGRSVKKFGSFLKCSSNFENRGHSLHLQQVKVLPIQITR